MKKSALVATIMNDEIRVNSVKNNHLYDLDIEFSSTSTKHVRSLESSTAWRSKIIGQESSMKISAPSQTLTDEDALALLMSDDECPDDVIEDAAVLCSVDHESGRITDPIRMTWDEFGTYAHVNNGRVEGPFNTNASRADDKKIIDCRAELNQLVPLKYSWAWDKYLSAGSTARASSAGMFAQQKDKQQGSVRVGANVQTTQKSHEEQEKIAFHR